jgi:hypothetical protein
MGGNPVAIILPLAPAVAYFEPMFDLTTGTVIYCVLVALGFLGLWLYYDRRDHLRFEKERRKTTFLCLRCDQLFTAPSGTELCKCPSCGHENTRLKF